MVYNNSLATLLIFQFSAHIIFMSSVIQYLIFANRLNQLFLFPIKKRKQNSTHDLLCCKDNLAYLDTGIHCAGCGLYSISATTSTAVFHRISHGCVRIVLSLDWVLFAAVFSLTDFTMANLLFFFLLHFNFTN